MRIPRSTSSPSVLVRLGFALTAHPGAEALAGAATFITPQAER